MEITTVVFRKFRRGGDIVAVFPYDIQNNLGECSSYQHIGQHGLCDPQYMVQNSSNATPKEFQKLKAELESIGYKLKIAQKISWKRWAKELEEFKKSKN